MRPGRTVRGAKEEKEEKREKRYKNGLLRSYLSGAGKGGCLFGTGREKKRESRQWGPESLAVMLE